MNRRAFIKSSSALAASAVPAATRLSAEEKVRSHNRGPARIAAYYFRAHMYTCVPRHVRMDMEWMADKGTDFVCPAVLEQDLFAAQENLDLITSEAERVGMRILAVPSRWAGLTAGAPKVPSLFSSLNPQTWMVGKDGTTGVSPQVSGVISSIHSPETLDFFCESLSTLFAQHPTWAGVIIDEPKAFRQDFSSMAKRALGEKAPVSAHHQAAADFYSRICEFVKKHWPDKYTILFEKADSPDKELAVSSSVHPLDYFGADGRPWGLQDDDLMKGTDKNQESGHGKVLLSGVGEKFIELAHRQKGRKSFLLLENHNLQASMIDALDRNYPAVLSLPADMFCYYYYPRNVEEPERVMEIIGRHLKRHTQG